MNEIVFDSLRSESTHEMVLVNVHQIQCILCSLQIAKYFDSHEVKATADELNIH